MRVVVVALLASCAAGCSFAKDPYLFTSLGDAALTIVPDASRSGGGEDAGVADGALDGGAPDAMLDAGFMDAAPRDTGPSMAGRALQLTSVDQGLTGIGQGLLPHGGAARTVEAWLRNPSAPRSAQIMGYGTEANAFSLRVVISPPNIGRLLVFDGMDVVSMKDVPALSDGSWHHVAVTMTATAGADRRSQIHFFVDGVFTSSGTKGANDVLGGNARALIIGGTPADAIGFSTGEIDEVRLWNTARTAAQISANRRAILRGSPGLVGYWAMNVEGGGSGLEVRNDATPPAAMKAPDLLTVGGPSFVPSSAF